MRWKCSKVRRALTTGGDTRDIQRRSLAVRAEDVMRNMRASVLVQYTELLRRYCNNSHNKKRSSFFPCGERRSAGMRKQRDGTRVNQFAQRCINFVASSRRRRPTRPYYDANLHLTRPARRCATVSKKRLELKEMWPLRAKRALPLTVAYRIYAELFLPETLPGSNLNAERFQNGGRSLTMATEKRGELERGTCRSRKNAAGTQNVNEVEIIR